jgi:hypothetical protein
MIMIVVEIISQAISEEHEVGNTRMGDGENKSIHADGDNWAEQKQEASLLHDYNE